MYNWLMEFWWVCMEKYLNGVSSKWSTGSLFVLCKKYLFYLIHSNLFWAVLCYGQYASSPPSFLSQPHLSWKTRPHFQNHNVHFSSFAINPIKLVTLSCSRIIFYAKLVKEVLRHTSLKLYVLKLLKALSSLFWMMTHIYSNLWRFLNIIIYDSLM